MHKNNVPTIPVIAFEMQVIASQINVPIVVAMTMSVELLLSAGYQIPLPLRCAA